MLKAPRGRRLTERVFRKTDMQTDFLVRAIDEKALAYTRQPVRGQRSVDSGLPRQDHQRSAAGPLSFALARADREPAANNLGLSRRESASAERSWPVQT